MVNRVVDMRRFLVCLALLGFSATETLAVELLVNGNFEAAPISGRPPGWSSFEQAGSVGRFYLDTPGSTIPAGDSTLSQFDTPDNNFTPNGGTQYAVSIAASDTTPDQGPGAHALYQSFSLPGTPTSVNLRFQFFSRDISNLENQPHPSGLDYTSAGTDVINQQIRVELLRSGASPLSTASEDVIFNFNQPESMIVLDEPDSQWMQYNRDITGLVAPGQNYTIRFASVSNRAVIVFGVDNVSIDYLGSFAIPESGSAFLFAPPALLLLGYAIRRKSRGK